jgi:hypothetical protein
VARVGISVDAVNGLTNYFRFDQIAEGEGPTLGGRSVVCQIDGKTLTPSTTAPRQGETSEFPGLGAEWTETVNEQMRSPNAADFEDDGTPFAWMAWMQILETPGAARPIGGKNISSTDCYRMNFTAGSGAQILVGNGVLSTTLSSGNPGGTLTTRLRPAVFYWGVRNTSEPGTPPNLAVGMRNSRGEQATAEGSSAVSQPFGAGATFRVGGFNTPGKIVLMALARFAGTSVKYLANDVSALMAKVMPWA